MSKLKVTPVPKEPADAKRLAAALLDLLVELHADEPTEQPSQGHPPDDGAETAA